MRYITDKLKPILENTYGCMVYQEQVMQIFRELAGYSYGRADIVRRAMSKKKLMLWKKNVPLLFRVVKKRHFKFCS